jgi:hypothetical protein
MNKNYRFSLWEEREKVCSLHLSKPSFLSYLYSEELAFREDRFHSKFTKNRPRLNIQTLVTIVPDSIVGDDFTQDTMKEELTILVNEDYLDVGMLGTSSEGFGSFSITTNGILLIKKIFRRFENSIKDKKDYERKIENLEANTTVKNWLKSMRKTLQDKAQDKIADLILSQVKVYGIQLIVLAIKFMFPDNSGYNLEFNPTP